MSVELTIILAIAAFTGLAILGNMLVFGAMFAHADRASVRDDDMPEDLSELTA